MPLIQSSFAFDYPHFQFEFGDVQSVEMIAHFMTTHLGNWWKNTGNWFCLNLGGRFYPPLPPGGGGDWLTVDDFYWNQAPIALVLWCGTSAL